MNTINYTKQLAKIHLNLDQYNIIDGLVNGNIVDTLQTISNNTNYTISYFKATYDEDITSKLINKEDIVSIN